MSGNNGAKLPEKITAQNDKAGNISFGMITYTMEDMIGAEENPDGSRTKEFIYTCLLYTSHSNLEVTRIYASEGLAEWKRNIEQLKILEIKTT